MDIPDNLHSVRAVLEWRKSVSPDLPAMAEWDGRWRPVDWREFAGRVERLAAFLQAKGLGSGDTALAVMPNGVAWEVVRWACLLLGLRFSALDPAEPLPRWKDILLDLKPALLIVGAPEDAWSYWMEIPHKPRLGITLRTSRRPPAPFPTFTLEQAAAPPAGLAEVAPDGPGCTIFTSGATGAPKTISYSQRQMVQAARVLRGTFHAVPEGGRMACWMPLSNLFQQVLNLTALAGGVTVYVVDEPRRVLEHTPKMRPDVFIAVPRFFERLQKRLEGRFALAPLQARRPGPLQRAVRAAGRSLIRAQVRRLFGRRLRAFVSGSAPLNAACAEFFEFIGYPVMDTYGVSESILPIAANRPEDFRVGAVGKPISPTEVRLSSDGEVLVRGPGLCAGYGDGRPLPLTPDGFYATGDEGRMEEGWLFVTGRVADAFKTADGQRVAPARAEAALNNLPMVDQAVVLGQGRARPLAVLSLPPDAPSALELAMKHLKDALVEVLADLPEAERPAGFLVLPRAFSSYEGDVTFNFKPRRAALEARYRPILDEIERRLKEDPGLEPYIFPVPLKERRKGPI